MRKTAYCIHLSEGIPVRRIVETETQTVTSDLVVRITDMDWDWNKKGKTTEFFVSIPKPGAFSGLTPEAYYHRRLRRRLSEEHGWRFEVYAPLSSLDV